MQLLWCWRCKAEMPMLDEVEFAEMWRLYGDGMKATKEFRQKWGLPPEGMESAVRFKPLLDRYEQLTGMKKTNPNAVMHHRLSQYGPPCKRCGKPLRTPEAKLCGACMFPVGE
jgi:ribosomal protein L37E